MPSATWGWENAAHSLQGWLKAASGDQWLLDRRPQGGTPWQERSGWSLLHKRSSSGIVVGPPLTLGPSGDPRSHVKTLPTSRSCGHLWALNACLGASLGPKSEMRSDCGMIFQALQPHFWRTSLSETVKEVLLWTRARTCTRALIFYFLFTFYHSQLFQ